MGTVVLYVLLTLVVAAALFLMSVWVFGRSEELPPVAAGATLTRLPEGDLTGDDVRAVQFRMCVRGYSMEEVDWTLDQAAAEIDRLREALGAGGGRHARSDVAAQRTDASGGRSVRSR